MDKEEIKHYVVAAEEGEVGDVLSSWLGKPFWMKSKDYQELEHRLEGMKKVFLIEKGYLNIGRSK